MAGTGWKRSQRLHQPLMFTHFDSHENPHFADNIPVPAKITRFKEEK